jgi:cell wall-associated NlpC family hydrolase
MFSFGSGKKKQAKNIRLKSSRQGILFGFCAGLLLFLFLLSSCGLTVGNGPYLSERNTARREDKVFQRDSSFFNRNSASSRIVSTARAQTGLPYHSGGTSPQSGFDCSGLVLWVYRQHGINVPRLAKAQAFFGRPVGAGELQPGDIVAFRLNGGYHTGIYSGNGNFVHSPSTGSRVREESININYWRRNFIGGRRII